MARAGIGRQAIVMIVIIVIAVSAVGVAYYETTQTTVNNVKFSLGFPASYFAAPHYYGLDLGYYKQNGINVTILPGTSGTAAITAVSTGQVDFALTDAAGLTYALLKSNITNVRIVAITFPKSFLGVLYDKADISTISDLNGKAGGAANPATSISTKLFLAVAKLNGLNVSSMKMQYGSQVATEPLVATGQADFVVGAAHDLAVLSVAAAKKGILLGFFPFSQYGVDNYGEVLISSTSMIQDHSSVVQGFVKATLQSLTAAILDPQSAVHSLVKYQSQLNETQMLQGWKIDVACCLQNVTANTDPLVFGYVSPQRMQQTVANVFLGLGVAQSIQATSLYTDAYTSPP
jgi:NitT/TauT family transport system substrate-binding protein